MNLTRSAAYLRALYFSQAETADLLPAQRRSQIACRSALKLVDHIVQNKGGLIFTEGKYHLLLSGDRVLLKGGVSNRALNELLLSVFGFTSLSSGTAQMLSWFLYIMDPQGVIRDRATIPAKGLKRFSLNS